MKRTATLLTLAAVVSAAAIPATADAKRGDVRVSGSCSGAAVAKLKAKPDNGKLAVEFEIDSNRRGQSWQVVIKRNGNAVYRATRKTAGRSGSFSAHKRTGNGAGVDRISARATGPGGQVCTAQLSI